MLYISSIIRGAPIIGLQKIGIVISTLVGTSILLTEGSKGIIPFVSSYVFYKGDIYYELLLQGTREQLLGIYDPAGYIAHHLLRLIGLSGYDVPIGTLSRSMATGIPSELVIGGGNISPIVASDILSYGNLLFIIIFSIVSGFIVGKLCDLRIYSTRELISFGIFIYWGLNSHILLIDTNTFSQVFTPIIIIMI